MKLSVIITTYNSEEWLRKVFIGYSTQTDSDFEIVVADDGSTPKTRELIESFSPKFKYPIIHVWHEDDGFQKPRILNKAILASQSNYLLFTDGDCIPRNYFIATHLRHKENGYFLSGGYFKLPMSISHTISDADIVSQNCFDSDWLRKQGLKFNFKLTKLTKNKWFAVFMNWLTPTKRSWNGHNSSGYKKDILAVNGFNEDMKYGGLDRELGERMFNNGMLSKQIRYSAICLHLDHKRSYATEESISKNQAIRKFNKKNKITWIPNGIKKNR